MPGSSASAVTGVIDDYALPVGLGTTPQVVLLTGEAIAGQTLTLSNGLTVTVISDSTAKTGVAGAKNLETAIITPNEGAGATSIAKKVAVTVNPTSTTPYSTFAGTVSSTSDEVTATGDFNTNVYNAVSDPTGDVGAPVQVAYNDTGATAPGYYSPFNLPPPATPASPTIVGSEICRFPTPRTPSSRSS